LRLLAAEVAKYPTAGLLLALTALESNSKPDPAVYNGDTGESTTSLQRLLIWQKVELRHVIGKQLDDHLAKLSAGILGFSEGWKYFWMRLHVDMQIEKHRRATPMNVDLGLLRGLNASLRVNDLDKAIECLEMMIDQLEGWASLCIYHALRNQENYAMDGEVS